MPLTKKGEKIMAEMKREYGEKKGEEVFYASANKGAVKGVHRDRLMTPDGERQCSKTAANRHTYVK